MARYADADLVRQAQAGNADAFGELYERYLTDVYKFFFYRTGSRPQAEDLTEDTFFKAWRHLQRLKPEEAGNFRLWLFRIARNTLIDHYRTRREEAPLEALGEGPVEATDVEERVFHMQDQERVAQALQRLPERLRDVIIYRFLHNFSHEETARLMGLKPNHVRVLQYRALKQLRQLLAEEAV
ncbi:MAG: RNA polymerase sigma factor [Chloroflexi bacterium]|nr:RNA polymerase sigma factor [Chloroflexota bacterium]